MKAMPDCVPEVMALMLDAARAVSDDGFIHRKVLLKVMAEIVEEGDLESDPAEFHLRCWEAACRSLGVRDPYENAKARGNKTALGILKMLGASQPAGDGGRPRRALRASLLGAMLDFSVLGRSAIQETAADSLEVSTARDDSEALEAALDKADSVLLAADRAGEIALDRPLAEAMLAQGKRVYLAVAAKPVFLMATDRDAAAVGFPPEAEVIDPGSPMFGLAPERASGEFREILAGVDVVVAKGAAHFAAMSANREVFFILKARDRETAERLGVSLNEGAIARMPAQEPA